MDQPAPGPADPLGRPPIPAWTAQASRARATFLLIVMTLSTFLFKVIEGLPYSLLRFMGGDLAASDAQIGLLVTGYAVVIFLISVPLAALTRRIPRRRVLATMIAVAAVATTATGFAQSYRLVLVTRLITAMAQALFWVAVLPGTAGLFPPEVRGRVLARLAIGNAFAPVLGLPTAAWVASHVSWRTAFWVFSGLALLVFSLVLALFPNIPAAQVGVTPTPFGSRRRFGFLLAETALLVAAAFGMITFITAFVLDYARFEQRHVPGLLMVLGLGGLIGANLIARLLDRAPWGAMACGAVGLGITQLALWAFGAQPIAAVVLIVLFGVSFGGMPPTLTQRALLCFPGSTDVAAGASSGTYNLGIAGGSALGAALVSTVGVRDVPLVGALLALLTLALLLAERRVCGPEPVATAAR